MVIKKKNIYRVLDLGTGTGILAFVLTKICKKVIATDIDLESEISITTNKRLNYENNIFSKM